MLRRSLMLCLKKPIISNSNCFSTIRYETANNHGHLKMAFHPHNLSTIEDFIGDKTNITYSDWNSIKENLTTVRGIDRNNVDSIILLYLKNSQRTKLGKEFVKQLQDNKKPLNIGIIGNLMKLYYNSGRNNVTDVEKQEIKTFYDDLLRKYRLLDLKTLSCFAYAFLVTDNWNESLSILENIKKMSTPPRGVYNAIIETVFHYGDAELGWKLLEEMTDKNIFPDTKVYTGWLQLSLKLSKNDKAVLLENLERMLTYCGNNELLMPVDAGLQYKNVFHDVLGWRAKTVTIKSSGSCQVCNSRLQSVDLSEEEFKLLQKTFYDKVIVGTNDFTKSTPKERSEFMSFLKEAAPFDVVLDGLNLLYSVPNTQNSNLLMSVVKHLVEKNKKVLLLGRKHLVKTLQKNQFYYLKENTDMFLTENLSHDDIYLLFAALSSKDTQFISRDLMRSHKFLLEDNSVKLIFKKWQKKNQLVLRFVEKNGNVFFKNQVTWLGTAQKHTGWHIPYILEDLHKLPDTFEMPYNWICLQPQTNETSSRK